MSHGNKNYGNKNCGNNSQGNKKFCKVCFDAGKSESVYTNHTVKTKNLMTGKMDTTCVTLLALNCRYCFENGHTVKFCPVLEANAKTRKNQDIQHARERHAQVQVVQQLPAIAKKGFAVLQDDSDDESSPRQVESRPVAVVDTPRPVSDEFPSLMRQSSSKSQSVAVLNFACAAALPAVPKPKITVVAAPPVAEKEYEYDSEDDEIVEEEEEEQIVVDANPFQFIRVTTNDSAPAALGYWNDDDW
jgi:hypothetical protein